MLHFKPHPILFCELLLRTIICLSFIQIIQSIQSSEQWNKVLKANLLVVVFTLNLNKTCFNQSFTYQYT